MPASRHRNDSQSLKKSKRLDSSTPIKNRNSKTSNTKLTVVSKSKAARVPEKKSVKGNGRQTSKKVGRQYEIAQELRGNTRICKFSAKQTQAWVHLDTNTRQQLQGIVDGALKTVGSKPAFAEDEDVQAVLSRLNLKLKSKLRTVRVPKQKSKTTTNVRTKMTQLQEDMESMVLQTRELEREIRQEERRIEALEDARELRSPTSQALPVKVPENELDLPEAVFYIT